LLLVLINKCISKYTKYLFYYSMSNVQCGLKTLGNDVIIDGMDRLCNKLNVFRKYNFSKNVLLLFSNYYIVV